MAILIVILIFILMFHLGEKGKSYREEKRIKQYQLRNAVRRATEQPNTPTEEEVRDRVRAKQQAAYRKELEERGFSEELITTILPQVMNN